MERYEVRVKFDEIKRLTETGNYQSAMEVADTVDWDRIKNIGMLMQAGEIYERCRYYEDSKAIYERAYRIQPQSRMIVYRLANVCAKLKAFDEAKEYLEEYRSIVPYDPNVLVLTYKIKKGEGAPVSELIAILEKLNQKDYHEKWAYELAVLYAEAEEEEKCAKECDNIFLWFGEGRYVLKALKLKSIFRTLTTEQERYLNSGVPVGAAEAVKNAEEAVRVSEEKEKEFIKLQEELDTSVINEDKIRDIEEAREEAINASREAKAAELLSEAFMEKEQEEEIIEQTETPEMLGETKMPTFNLPIMDVLQASHKVTAPEEAVKANVVPGMEFIDMSYVNEEVKETDAPAVKKDPIEEARERIRTFAKESEQELNLIGYEIPDEPEVAVDIPVTESNEANSVQYTDMGELLSHADEMKSDDLARSLALILSGKTEDKEEDKEITVEAEFENPAKKLQGVINRIWSKSATKRSDVYRNEDDYEVDTDMEDIEIPQDEASRFDTLNLQKDLANSINNILNATEEDEIKKTIAVMDRSMLKSNISKYTAATEEKKADKADWEEELGDILSEETLRKIQEFDGFDTFEQESDGQIKLSIETEEKEDSEIPGQINLEEYFINKDKEQLDAAKMRAIKIAGEYMEQVTKAAPIIAEEEAMKYLADSQKVVLDEARRLMESTTPDADEIDSVIKSLSMMIAYANEKAAENEITDKENTEEIKENVAVINETVTEPEETVPAEETELEETVPAEEAEPEEIVPVEETELNISEEPEVTGAEEIQVEDISIEEEVLEELPEIELPEMDVPEISEETLESMAESKEKFMDSISDVGVKEVKDLDKKKAEKQVIPMSDEQLDIMDYFMNVPEIESQIADFIEIQHDKFDNMIICGATGSGRASLALRLYKSIRLNNPALPNQTLKVDADALNKKSVLKIYEKISSGIVLIEHAGLLNDMAVSELKEAMKKYEGKIYTIIIGNPDRIGKLLENHKEFNEMCKYKFTLPEYNQDQFVDFAKSYAYSFGYVIDDMALLALYSELSAIKTKNKLITLQDVKNIINDAMTNSDARAKKLFSGMFAKNKDREGNIILKEKDFVI